MMRFKTFAVGCYSECSELNTFISTHRVLRVERQFTEECWCFLVEYDEHSDASLGRNVRGPKVDYREVLSAEDFAIFAKLRDVRKRLAENEGVALFAVATNEQLAQFVQTKAHDAAGLKAVAGFGSARVEKYGEAFLEVLLNEAPIVEINEKNFERK